MGSFQHTKVNLKLVKMNLYKMMRLLDAFHNIRLYFANGGNKKKEMAFY